MKLFFDVETIGLPTNFHASSFDTENWPRIVQLAYVLEDEDGYIIKEGNHVVEPDGFEILDSSTNIHGISQWKAEQEGDPIRHVLSGFLEAAEESDILIAHNLQFDLNVILAEFNRLGMEAEPLYTKKKVCTMKRSTMYYSQFEVDGDREKWPKLQELYYTLFDRYYDHEHDAEEDVKALMECYEELVEEGIIKVMSLDRHYEILDPLYDLFAETRRISNAQLRYLLSKVHDLWLEIEFEQYANAPELRNQCTFIIGFITAIAHGGQITDSQKNILFSRLYQLLNLISHTNEEDVVVPYLKIEDEDRSRPSSAGGYFPRASEDYSIRARSIQDISRSSSSRGYFPSPEDEERVRPTEDYKKNWNEKDEDDLPF